VNFFIQVIENSSIIKEDNNMLPVIYAIVMVIAYVSFPPNPDKITVPMDLITSFRVAGAITIGLFWWLMDITQGSFWGQT
jgi:predicted cobalt transporter CbtA